MSIQETLGWLAATMALIGIGYQLCSIWAARRFFGRNKPRSSGSAGVTLLKPLHGNEPRLYENLASFMQQDYSGPVQMVCGLATADDPAAEVVRALQAQFPDQITLVINPVRHGGNAKVSNLINMLPSARHEMLIMSDSDMAAPPDYISVILGALEQPGVGAVTCPFYGRGDAGFWSRVSAAMISFNFMFQVIVGHVTGMAKPCVGATIAVGRPTIEALGGFTRFKDVLADDYALGAAVRELGLHVVMPPMALPHGCDEPRLRVVWQHHVRWATTVREIFLLGHVGSITTHPLGFAMITTAFNPALGAALCAATLGARWAVFTCVNRFSGQRTAPFWVMPLADLLCFGAFLASLTARTIDWRGSQLTIAEKGSIALRSSIPPETP